MLLHIFLHVTQSCLLSLLNAYPHSVCLSVFSSTFLVYVLIKCWQRRFISFYENYSLHLPLFFIRKIERKVISQFFHQLLPISFSDMSTGDVNFTLQRESGYQWWELREERRQDQYNSKSPLILSDYLTITLFNDRVAPEAFSIFTNYG